MVVVINLASREDQAKNLAAFVAKLSGGAEGEADAAKLESLTKTVDSGKFTDVITALVKEIPEVFKAGDAADIEGFFVEILAIAGTLSEEEQKEAAKALVAQITAQKDTPLVRIRMLTKLYNFFASDASSRFDIFRALLEYAKEDSSLAATVQPALATVDQRLAEWKATVEQKRVIYQLVHEVHEKTPGSALLSYQSLLALLATYEEGDAAPAKEAAARAAVLAVSLPEAQDYSSLLALKAVKQLESGEFAALHKLLSTFVAGDLAQYEATVAKEKATFEKHSLDTAAGLKKIRMTAFSGLAAKDSNLTFAAIAGALNVKEEQVEDWIIAAVASGCLEAKIDQVGGKVFVERCPQQVFGKEHWASMKSKVASWQESISRMLAVLDQAN